MSSVSAQIGGCAGGYRTQDCMDGPEAWKLSSQWPGNRGTLQAPSGSHILTSLAGSLGVRPFIYGGVSTQCTQPHVLFAPGSVVSEKWLPQGWLDGRFSLQSQEGEKYVPSAQFLHLFTNNGLHWNLLVESRNTFLGLNCRASSLVCPGPSPRTCTPPSSQLQLTLLLPRPHHEKCCSNHCPFHHLVLELGLVWTNILMKVHA